MLKLSFKFHLSVILLTVVAVVFVTIHFVKKTVKENDKHTLFAQTKAFQTADFGFQIITEKAMSPETGAFMIDSLRDIYGSTGDGGEYSVSVIKDTISVDSIEIKIDSRGIFANEEHSQSKRILLVSSDLINWVIAD